MQLAPSRPAARSCAISTYEHMFICSALEGAELLERRRRSPRWPRPSRCSATSRASASSTRSSRSELLRLRHRRAARPQRVGGVAPAAAAARHAPGAPAPRRPHGLLRPRRSAHRPPLRAGARARGGARRRLRAEPASHERGGEARMTATCTVCELHAESTFKIEGMDCREEVALIERRFKNLRPRGLLGRPHRPAAAREVRRREAVGVDDRRRRRRRRDARVARARRADRRPAIRAARAPAAAARRRPALRFAGGLLAEHSLGAGWLARRALRACRSPPACR